MEGRKTYEFRKTIFKNPNVRTIVIYSSSPVQKVIGEFTIREILTMTPKDLWKATKSGSGIDSKYFDSYFRGKSKAHALKVTFPKRYDKPLELKRDFGIRMPPQSFCYLYG